MRYIWVGIAYVVFGAVLYGADANSAATVPPTPSAAVQQPAGSEPNSTGTMTVKEAISRQKNIQNFSALALDRTELLQLAWAGHSVIAASKNGITVDLYFCLADGIYRYDPAANSLDSLGTVDIRGQLAVAAQNEAALQEAPCAIIVAGSRTQPRDKMMFDAGKISQTISLEATSIGLAIREVGSFDISKVKRLTKISVQREPLYMLAVGYPAGAMRQRIDETAKHRALLIIDGSDRSAELFNIIDVLTAADIQLTVAQRGKTAMRTDRYQRMIDPDMQPQDAVVTDYDAVIVVGNSGSIAFMRDQMILNIVRQAIQAGKIVGALGDAAQILANAGILNGVRVTGDRRLLLRSGGIYTDQLVESDQGIVTAMTSQQSSLFARMIIDTMKNAAPQAPTTIRPTSRQKTY